MVGFASRFLSEPHQIVYKLFSAPVMGVVFNWKNLMSSVTDVILTLSLMEERDEDDALPAVDRLNEYLLSRKIGKLERVDGSAGGRKVFQAVVLLGAFNHLNLEDLIRAIAVQEWVERDDVQLFVKGEHDDTFTIREILQPAIEVDYIDMPEFLRR